MTKYSFQIRTTLRPSRAVLNCEIQEAMSSVFQRSQIIIVVGCELAESFVDLRSVSDGRVLAQCRT